MYFKVGLDIQQKFRALYLGNQKLGPNVDAELKSESKYLSNNNLQLISGEYSESHKLFASQYL